MNLAVAGSSVANNSSDLLLQRVQRQVLLRIHLIGVGLGVMLCKLHQSSIRILHLVIVVRTSRASDIRSQSLRLVLLLLLHLKHLELVLHVQELQVPLRI